MKPIMTAIIYHMDTPTEVSSVPVLYCKKGYNKSLFQQKKHPPATLDSNTYPYQEKYPCSDILFILLERDSQFLSYTTINESYDCF